MTGASDIWDVDGEALSNPTREPARGGVRGPLAAAGVMSAIFVLTVLRSLHSNVLPGTLYLAMHTMLELISVLVSLMIFALNWSLRGQGRNSRRVAIGAGFLAIGLLDLMHAMSFKGMPDFLSPNSPDKAILFWLVARCLTAGALMLVALLRDVRWSGRTCYLVTAATLSVAIATWVAGTFFPERLPRLYIEGQGLTLFKLVAEYALAGLFVAEALILGTTGYRRRNQRRLWAAAAAWCLFMSELYFTFHASVFDITNIYGHLFKTGAFMMLFRASFIAGVREPYRQLAQERSLQGALLTALPDPIWLKSPTGVFLACNTAFEQMAGLPAERIIGLDDYQIFDKAQADLFRRNDLLALRGGTVNVNEELVETANRQQRLFETSKSAVHLPDGTLLGVLGIAHDITERRAVAERLEKLAAELERENAERRQAETELVAANTMYDAVIRGMPVALMVLDAQGAVITWNEAARRTFGYGENEILGKPGRTVFAEKSLRAFEAVFQDAGTAPSRPALEVSCIRQSGAEFPALLHQAAVCAADGTVRAVIFAIEDVSERRSIEAQLRQAQKMEAIGQLTAGIAHDFNNILAIIVGNLELVLDEEGKTLANGSLVHGALNASLRGAALTQRLLAYSRQQTLEPSVVNIGRLLRAEQAMVRRTLEESITIETRLPRDLWSVRVDAARLLDSLLNLVLNARDSMPRGGRLTIGADNVTLDEDYCSRHLDVAPGEYVRLSIGDTGVGMSRDVLDQALEPFFTTKPMGAGSGLGLSMVYGFVMQSRGHMEIDSTPGAGTTVRLYLPRSADRKPAAVQGRTADAAPRPAAGEGILLVEDDADVREMLVTYLTRLGYRVVETRDGQEALSVLRSDGALDAIVTDVVLPGGMRGPDIVAAAGKIAPGLKALYISGYSENALSSGGELLEGIHLLTKPFRMAELARKLRDLLEA